MPKAKPNPKAEAALDAAVTRAAALPHAPTLQTDAESLLAPATLPPHPAPQPPGPAASAYARLIHYIQSFEAALNPDQEIAMGFTGSAAGVLKIEGLGFLDPDLITFYGHDEDGTKTQLVQHVSQLSVMLRAVPKSAPERPANRIGFRLTTGWRGGESGDASA
jgi:hypothetical protein